jgi:D-alanine-D-alanine ligase
MDCVEELWDAYQCMDEAGGYVFLVYRNAGRVLGYACFGRHSLTDGAFDLYWIAVDPAAQGRGIGRALLARVEEEVRYRNGYLLIAETSSAPPYASARHLYESNGYHCEAIIHDFYGRGDHLQVFVKDLGAEPQQDVLKLDRVPAPA